MEIAATRVIFEAVALRLLVARNNTRVRSRHFSAVKHGDTHGQ